MPDGARARVLAQLARIREAAERFQNEGPCSNATHELNHYEYMEARNELGNYWRDVEALLKP